jgi:hypothetical protein
VFADVAAEVETRKKKKKDEQRGVSAHKLKLLPANTGLTFKPGTTNKDKSGERFKASRVAKTLTDLANLSASGQWEVGDLGWDLVRGLVKLNRDPSGSDAVITLGSLLPPHRSRAQRRQQARTANSSPPLRPAGAGVRPPQRGARTRSQAANLPPEGAVFRVAGIKGMTLRASLIFGATELDWQRGQDAARTDVACDGDVWKCLACTTANLPGNGVCDYCSTERRDDGLKACTTDEQPPRPASSTTVPRKRKRQRRIFNVKMIMIHTRHLCRPLLPFSLELKV